MLYGRYNKMKTMAQIRKDLGKTCQVPGCSEPITTMHGPGEDKACRHHQLLQSEYGGPGHWSRPYTFHRQPICADCGVDIRDVVRKKYPDVEQRDPNQWTHLTWQKIVWDHTIRQADGGDDTQDNGTPLCLFCNNDKTVINEDYMPGKRIQPTER